MKIYLVGGAVRDILLGISPKDRDFIVLESSPEEMLNRGFIRVGKGHQVFLHPKTGEEHSLAEALELDLARRDLTINAMALIDNHLVDPFHGQNDLNNKMLRHVKDENFFIDPLRVYRVARFQSQFPDFRICSKTVELMRKVVTTGESFRNLSLERVFKELVKALLSRSPSLFFKVLIQTKALEIHFPELQQLNEHNLTNTLKLIDTISKNNSSDPKISFTGLFIHLDEQSGAHLFQRLLVPVDWQKSARNVLLFYSHLRKNLLTPESLIGLLYRMDAFRNEQAPNFIAEILRHDGKTKISEILLQAFEIAKNVSVRDLPTTLEGKSVGDHLKKERIQRLISLWKELPNVLR